MKKLKGLIEELVEGEEKMARVASDYFKGMFTASQTMSCYNMLFGIPNCIQEGMNNELIAKFWVEEVVEVAKRSEKKSQKTKISWLGNSLSVATGNAMGQLRRLKRSLQH